MPEQDKSHILIVDDTPANIDVLGSILMDHYEISAAINGPIAIEVATSPNPPDLILLDIMMPEMDGYDVARELKSRQKTRTIPIIFVTAKSEDEDEALGLSLGAVDYIRKPVSPAVTLARINSHLELKKHRDRLKAVAEQKTNEAWASEKLLKNQSLQLNRVEDELKSTEVTAEKNFIYFQELFTNSPYGIILLDTDSRIIRSNKSFIRLTGYSQADLCSMSLEILWSRKTDRQRSRELTSLAMKRKVGSLESALYHKKGNPVPVSALSHPVIYREQVQGVFIIFQDISERKFYEAKLKHQAYHDVVTGIPNRAYFNDRLDQAIKLKQSSSDYSFAVLLIDLDRFKTVNDTMGHQAGDKLLNTVTSRIKFCLRSADTIARLGGDEFAILIPNINEPHQVFKIAERIKATCAAPFNINEEEVSISASTGIVMDITPDDTREQIIRNADLAMYHAKAKGRGCFKVYRKAMHDKAVKKLSIEKRLRHAIENNHLLLFYQPIFSVSTQQIKGFEALIRWNDPDQGMILPDQFIPVAEESGLIIPMGQWVINQACKQLKSWKKEGIINSRFFISVNVSIKQFLQKGFAASLNATVGSCGLAPEDIRLEITESLLMEHTAHAVKILKKLKDKGFLLAIDDFGTGYSSLSYLKNFPVDIVKIDREFINTLEKNNIEIVKSIISMSNSLGLSVVAEGVENREQLDILNNLSCENAQGYYYAKPLSEIDATCFLKKSAPR